MRKRFGIFGAAIGLLSPFMAYAAIGVENTGLSATGNAAFSTTGATSLSTFIGFYIIQPVFGLIGLLFFCLSLYAGILWMTARGDTKKVDSAKNILVSSTIGLVIIVASYVLTNAVLGAITTGSIT